MIRSNLLIALGALSLCGAASPASAAGLGSLYGCEAQGSSNTAGAVVGGLIGALAGSQVSKDNRAIGAAIGAGVGAAIGNNLGCRMDRKARLDAQQAFQRALDTGKAQSWSDPQTGAAGRIEVLERIDAARSPQPDAYNGRWRFAEGVAPAARTGAVGGAYAASSRINLRAGPSASARIVDRLQAGETIQVAGAVAGGWLAVEEAGRIQGYVARAVVRPAQDSARGYDNYASGGGYGGGDCRRVRQTLSEQGQPSVREDYTACRGADGQWNLTAT